MKMKKLSFVLALASVLFVGLASGVSAVEAEPPEEADYGLIEKAEMERARVQPSGIYVFVSRRAKEASPVVQEPPQLPPQPPEPIE